MNKKIYIVVKQYQDHDGDEYRSWIGKRHISYHESMEGAEKVVSEKIIEDHKSHMDNYKNNAHWNLSDWQQEGMKIMDNKISLCVNLAGGSQNDQYKPHDRYIIKEKELLT